MILNACIAFKINTIFKYDFFWKWRLNETLPFISKKISEVKSQINQLENNLQFFTNVEEDNPLVKEVHNNIKAHRETLKLWENKLNKIIDICNILVKILIIVFILGFSTIKIVK